MPFDLRALLQRVRPATRTPTPHEAAFHEQGLRYGLQLLDDALPQHVSELGFGPAAGCISFGANRLRVASEVLNQYSEAAWLLTTDGDGYIREAAIWHLASPPQTPGRFVALILRLNDWVPQVRGAAVDAAARLFPQTGADTIIAAAPYILSRRFLWARWSGDERNVLDAAFQRPDVVAALTKCLLTGRTGALGATLRNALRTPCLDGELLRLAFDASLPPVRAVALRTLLEGRATWAAGHTWSWQDKSYGIRRRVPCLESRDLTASPPAPDLIRRGLKDPSAVVRRVAASALIARVDEMPDAAELAAALALDISRSVRERADFLLRDLANRASPRS